MADDDGPEHGQTYGLITPFLDTDPQYAFGCEFGMLVERLREADEFRGYVTTANQDQVTLHASRNGWAIDVMRPWPEGAEWPDWFWLEMHRISPAL